MMGRVIVAKQPARSRIIVSIPLLAIMLVLVCTGAIVVSAPGWLYPRDVSIRQLYEHPSVYVGEKVNIIGYLVKHAAPHFGDTYTLCEGDPRNLYFAVNPCVAVAGAPSTIDPYVGLVYNGTNFEAVPSPCSFAVLCRVVISGVFTDQGPVTDASQYLIEAYSVKWHE